jgi:hypothetical protein
MNDDKKVRRTKSEVNAEKILRRCHIHDSDHGGVFSLITGSQGSGKTSVMLSFMDYTMQHHGDEKIFFSNTYRAPMQSLKIGVDRHHIMVKKGCGVSFHDRNNKLKVVKPKVTYFRDMDELWDKALPGVCNTVFFGEVYRRGDNMIERISWMDFIHYLRGVGEWCHIYIDELSEIAPQFQAGEAFHKIGRFGIDLKEIRKCMINCHTNSQSVADIDPRVRSKVMIRIYMPGARSGAESRVTQRAIDNLEENPVRGNQGYLEASGKFGKTRFMDIYRPNMGFQWEARIDGS